MLPLVAFITGLVVTAAAIALGTPFASRLGLMDEPSARKAHKGEVPLFGGIAIFLGLILALLIAGGISSWAGILAGGIVVVITGIWDDRKKVSSGVRLIAQSLAILTIVYFCNAILTDLGHIGWGGEILQIGLVAIPFTIFAGVGIINAINMSDGLDGLCGMLALVTLFGFAVVAVLAGRTELFLLTIVLGGCIIGFLFFNFRFPGRSQARVFLGDGGTYLIGFVIVFLAIKLSQGPERAMSPVTALWLIMVPLLDTAGMILRRLHRGRSPFAADREHLHHVFLLAKFTVTETVLIMTGIALAGVLVGLVSLRAGVPESLMLALFLAVAGGYYWMIMHAWRVMRFLSRSINRRGSRRDRRILRDRRKDRNVKVEELGGEERRSGIERRENANDRRVRDVTETKQRDAAKRHRDYPITEQIREEKS
ncbi:MAG: MraY family glycosyltransferase [Gammaproteobacteria bacterium]